MADGWRALALPLLRMADITRWILGAQGAMYVATGLWPLLHMPSFEAVTGAKTDDWLVHTVGLLLAVIGGVLLTAVMQRRTERLVMALAIGTAIALAGIDIVYVLNGTISRIYLLDAAIELAIVAALLAASIGHGASRRKRAVVGN